MYQGLKLTLKKHIVWEDLWDEHSAWISPTTGILAEEGRIGGDDPHIWTGETFQAD